MSLVNLITSEASSLFITSFRVGTFEFDILSEESHESGVEVTENPVEGGGTVSDHVFNVGDVVTVRGVLLSYSPKFGGGSSNRKKDLYSDLLSVLDEKEPRPINTTLKDYKDMILVGVSANQAETDQLDVMLTFKKIDIVSTVTVGGLVVQAPPQQTKKPDNPTKVDGKKEGKPAAQAKKPDAMGRTNPAPAPTTQKQSAAKKIGDIFRGK